MQELHPDTLHTLGRLARGQMGAAELAGWLAGRFPDLWDSGMLADRHVLSELSLALESGSVPRRTLARRARALAKELGVKGIEEPSEVEISTSWGASADVTIGTSSAQRTVLYPALEVVA